MDPGLLKLLDDDEDEIAPAAADVDAFAAVLKGELGGAAHAAAAAFSVTRAGNGTVQPQPLPHSPVTSAVTTGHNGSKPVPVVPSTIPSGQQQQLLWNQLTPDQQREVFQRRVQQQRMQQQQQIQQQQIQQQPPQQQQKQQPPQQQESGSSSSGSANRRTMPREGISFTALMPLLQPHLPTEQGQQLAVLYQQFKTQEISREDFIRGARVIAGDQVLVQTIRQMHMKQQAQLHHQQQLQQQKLQQQQLQQQQQQSQPQSQQQLQAPQPQLSQPQQTQPPPNSSAVSSNSTLPEASNQQQQQHSQESAKALQQNPQQQMNQSSQSQEPIVTNAEQQSLPPVHPQAHPFQQTQVPSNTDLNALPHGTQPNLHLSSSLPQTQLQTPSVMQGDQQKDPGQGQQPNHKVTSPMVLQQVKLEVDKSLASSQSAPFPSMQSSSAAHQSQTVMVAGAGQPSQPHAQTGLPQQPALPGQVPGHLQLQPLQPGSQVPGTASLPVSLPLQAQPQPQEKPLTKYAKQKLRKEQKKREEEERLRKQAEEESLKKLQTAPSSMVTGAHQGLHPQVPTAQPSHPVDLNMQSFSHHPGSLSQQAQLQVPVSQVDKQHLNPSGSGLVASGQGPSLIPVKQEPSDLQSEQKRQSRQSTELLSGQAVQKPSGQTQLPEAVQGPGSKAEQSPAPPSNGAVPHPSLSTTPNSTQQAGMASMPAPVGASGLQSTLSLKQVAGLQRTNSITQAVPTTCAYNATSMLPVSTYNSSAPPIVGSAPGQSAQAAAPVTAAPNKTTPKKPAAGQKKMAESAPAQQPPSKKQKVTAGEPDQSIDQLNDVTAVSGVNLKEEEEQLLAGPREGSGTSEAMRKIVQEEEERLFLEREPLRAKVAAIATRCGVKSVSEDVGRCLSMSVEERLRSMLYKLIKLSKQRCDVEKDRHKVVITSDVRRQILLLKRKAKELLDKKLAEESERLRKLSEKKDKGSLPEVEREELKAKAQKAQQEEDDRLKATAANVAARAAVGADDMLLKWQLMAEQGRQKRQGGGETGAPDESTSNRAGTSAEGAAATNSEKKLENGDSSVVRPGSHDADSQGPPIASATGRPPGPGPGSSRSRHQLMTRSGRAERTVMVKDIIAFLETEPQMSKSTLLYRLYERKRKSDGEKSISRK